MLCLIMKHVPNPGGYFVGDTIPELADFDYGIPQAAHVTITKHEFRYVKVFLQEQFYGFMGSYQRSEEEVPEYSFDEWRQEGDNHTQSRDENPRFLIYHRDFFIDAYLADLSPQDFNDYANDKNYELEQFSQGAISYFWNDDEINYYLIAL